PACPTRPCGSRAVVTGYAPHSLGTHLAATPWHANPRTTASDDWAEICRPVWGRQRDSWCTGECHLSRAYGGASLRSGNTATPLCHGCPRRPCHSSVVHAGMP